MRRTTLLATGTGAIALALVFTTLPATAAPPRETLAIESRSDLRPRELVVGAREEPTPAISGAFAFTPDSFQDGNPITITVSGSVSVTSEHALKCNDLRMGAFGRSRDAIEYKFLSPRTFSTSPGVAQTLSVSDELNIDQAQLQKLSIGQALTVYVWADCYYSPSADGWDSDQFYVIFAEHKITPTGLQLRPDDDWIFPDTSFLDGRPKWHKTAAKLNFYSPGPKPILTVLRNGKPVWTFKAPASSGSVSLPMSVVAPRATYTMRITAGQVPQVSVPLRVFHGVTTFWGYEGRETPILTWPKCSTIRWHYDASNAPKSAGTFIAELEQVMKYFTRVTGIQYERTNKGTANFFIGWAKKGLLGEAGWGGVSGSDTEVREGHIYLVSTNKWARTPGMKSPGRGPAIFHEMGHAMGLGHVVTEDSLMYGTYNFGKSPNSFSKLEGAFLREIYEPETCK